MVGDKNVKYFKPDPLNAPDPIFVTLAGMVIVCKLGQFSNTLDSIVCKFSGSIIDFKLEQSLNVSGAITVTVGGITTDSIVELPCIELLYTEVDSKKLLKDIPLTLVNVLIFDDVNPSQII